MKVPFLDLPAQQAEIAAEVLGVWKRQFEAAEFVGGPEVAAFEAEYASYIGVNHCVGVGNGTDAIEIALRAVGVEPGDEVILPANTFIATAEAVSRIGAVPVLADVDDRYLLIDPGAVEAAITKRTRAIVPVHIFGQTAPVEALREMARKHDLAIIEDAAQSQGASSLAGRAGSLGRIAATSFYPGKNLGAAGDGGAVMTNDAELADFARNVSAHGSTIRYVHDRVGFNSRLDAIQASELRAKLRRLDKWNDLRREAADRYADLLADVPGIRVPQIRYGNADVWHLYVVRVEERSRVLAELGAAGIGAAVHYPTPIHLTAAYSHLGYKHGEFPTSELAAEQILSLPMFPHIREEQQATVVRALTLAVGSS